MLLSGSKGANDTSIILEIRLCCPDHFVLGGQSCSQSLAPPTKTSRRYDIPGIVVAKVWLDCAAWHLQARKSGDAVIVYPL